MSFKANLNGKLILIVDEDRNSGSILSAKLLNGGYSSTYVKSCKSAIDLIVTDNEPFDAVLVSLNSLSDEYLNFPKNLRTEAAKKNIKLSVNEVGITFYSKTNLESGLVLSVSTPFLESLGMNQSNLRVFHREPLSKPHDDKHFMIEAHFISITPKDAVAIRKATIEAAKKKASI